MEKEVQREFHTFFFIESHPKSINKQAEVKLREKQPNIQPLRKLLEKDFKSSEEQEDFTVSVYAGDIFPSLIKEKDIKIVKNYLLEKSMHIYQRIHLSLLLILIQ